MSCSTTQKTPDDIVNHPEVDITINQLYENKAECAFKRKDSTSTLYSEAGPNHASSSSISEDGSRSSATSASYVYNSNRNDNDAASEISDEIEEEVLTLLEGHGVLIGYGRSDYFGGNFTQLSSNPGENFRQNLYM